MKIRDADTIAAIATPQGEGAISIVRLSGKEAIRIADSLFQGKKRIVDSPSHTAHFGTLVDPDGLAIDQVVVTVFREPTSYTGENMVEVSCHGGLFITAKVMEALLGSGTRQAEPGEFTKRAFLSGKIDLSQAEAVADLIAARSQRAHAVSLNQLQGVLAGRVHALRDELLSLCSLLELELDFSEEDISLISREEILARIDSTDGKVAGLVGSFSAGKIAREGVTLSLIGPPNVGKSSIFNYLLMENRAIVTSVAGTTRDSIEENLTLGGVLFRLVDTAGIRETPDLVEQEGVRRTEEAVRRSDILAVVLDTSQDYTREKALCLAGELLAHQRTLFVHNKVDLLEHHARPKIETVSDVYVSAKTGEGMDVLKAKLIALVSSHSNGDDNGVRITRTRHLTSLEKAREYLKGAVHSVQAGLANEFIALDVRSAVDALAELTGEVTTDDVLNHIFGSFCVGK